MIVLLILLIAVIAGSDIFSKDLSLLPGLSAKNAMLYAVGMALFFRGVIAGTLRIERPAVHALFGVWFGYALLSCIVAAAVIQYPGYDFIGSLLTLKSLLIDAGLFFLVAFYGPRTLAEARLVLKALAAAMCVASLVTVLDVAGIVHFGIRVGEEGVEAGRVFGVFGHANDTAALIVCMLPLVLASASSGRWPVRLLWYAGALATVAVLLLTVSRGAYAGALIGSAVAIWLCRRYVRPGRIAIAVLVGIAVVFLALVVAGAVEPQIRGILADRLLGQSRDIDVSEASSGRASIWTDVVLSMLSQPITLLTGYGWNVYSTMSFGLVTHNYYLDLWFELGVVGVLAFLLIMGHSILGSLRALPLAARGDRPYFLAFVFGICMLLAAVFFSNVYKALPYIWMYVGVTLRAATLTEPENLARLADARPAVRGAHVRLGGGTPRRVTPVH